MSSMLFKKRALAIGTNITQNQFGDATATSGGTVNQVVNDINIICEAFEKFIPELESNFGDCLEEAEAFIENQFLIAITKIETGNKDLYSTISNNVENIRNDITSKLYEYKSEIIKIQEDKNKDLISALEESNIKLTINAHLLNEIQTCIQSIQSTGEKTEEITQKTFEEILKQGNSLQYIEQKVSEIQSQQTTTDNEIADLTKKLQKFMDAFLAKNEVKDMDDLQYSFRTANDFIDERWNSAGHNFQKFTTMLETATENIEKVVVAVKSIENKIDNMADTAKNMDNKLSSILLLAKTTYRNEADCPRCHTPLTRKYRCRICDFDGTSEEVDKEYLNGRSYRFVRNETVLIIKNSRNGKGSVELGDNLFIDDDLVKYRDTISRILFCKGVKEISLARNINNIFDLFPNLRYVAFEKLELGEARYELKKGLFSHEKKTSKLYGMKYVSKIESGCFSNCWFDPYSNCLESKKLAIENFCDKYKINETLKNQLLGKATSWLK